ncbi:hypothetical protein [Bacillus massilinigeriensis]|uniref:hypothetical protein n=1 Tax=Bacillus massilionigeriensis TaxID=1805475 RepID=UPI00096AF8CD|nr:hypothetical protein [Bacillus massilionigeriensis]
MWNIIKEDVEWEIEVGPITILKGQHGLWYELIRMIDDFFSNKGSIVKIFEDTQLLNKKDWDCLFIPFDCHLLVDKITSKSPLKPLLEGVCEDLILSPAYNELLNIWEELREEVQFIKSKVEKYGLELQLESFDLEQLKSFLTFHTLKRNMTPIGYKKLMLDLFIDKNIEKKQLIIIELPELYSNNRECKKFCVIGYTYQLRR